jgi:transcriptional regulator
MSRPTWNYQVVHAHGTLNVHDDERQLRGLVGRLTRHHEAGEAKPWKMGDAPPDYVAGMLAQIVGISVTVHSLVGKSKLGQNKAVADRLGAAAALQAQGQLDMARLMRTAGGPA